MTIIDRTFAVLPVSDIEEAEAWYERFFGRPADAKPMPSLREWHEGSGGFAVLQEAGRAGKAYATMLVASIDDHRAALAERGLTLGESQGGDAAGVAQIDDPAGNTITLAQRRVGSDPQSGENAAIVRGLIEAFRDRRRDDADALLADDFTFTSQYDDHIDRDAYFERCWPNGDQFSEMRIERITPDSEGAVITYFGATMGGNGFRNTEYLTVFKGQIHSTDVYFGASFKDGKVVTKPSPSQTR